ncbi:ATP-binding protein [Spirillospora sp. NPDC127200]
MTGHQYVVLTHAALNGLGLDGQGDACMVLVSELVTNAVRYGGPGPVYVRLAVGRGVLVCGVSDTGSEAPVPTQAGLDGEGGRGLALLAQLSTECGWYRTGTGKTVWFAQHLHAAPQPTEPFAPKGAFPTAAGPAHSFLARADPTV